jgi:hypothetical protein
MSLPPVDPTGRDPLADASPTEPVPAFAAPAPAFAAPEPPPAAPVPDRPAYLPGMAFTPVAPEPGPGDAYVAPVAAASATTRGSSVSSRVLNIALGAAILVGAVGIAFAAGRATAPASAGAVANASGGQPAGNGQANGNGTNRGNAGPLPGASFDLNGGNGGPGDDNGAGLPGDGFGRGGLGGFGGLGISGTVTAVTPDSVTIKTDAGVTVTVGLDGTTAYHQQAAAAASDVKTGTKVQVQVEGRFRPGQGASGGFTLGTASDVTVVP